MIFDGSGISNSDILSNKLLADSIMLFNLNNCSLNLCLLTFPSLSEKDKFMSVTACIFHKCNGVIL